MVASGNWTLTLVEKFHLKIQSWMFLQLCKTLSKTLVPKNKNLTVATGPTARILLNLLKKQKWMYRNKVKYKLTLIWWKQSSFQFQFSVYLDLAFQFTKPAGESIQIISNLSAFDKWLNASELSLIFMPSSFDGSAYFLDALWRFKKILQ